MFDLIENAAWTVCCYKAMSESIRKLAIAALSEKLETFMGNLQIAQQKTDSTLSIMMNGIQEIWKSQEYLGSKYEKIKMKWKQCKLLQFWKAVATDTPVDLQMRKLISYATCDITVTHNESAVGLVETN